MLLGIARDKLCQHGQREGSDAVKGEHLKCESIEEVHKNVSVYYVHEAQTLHTIAAKFRSKKYILLLSGATGLKITANKKKLWFLKPAFKTVNSRLGRLSLFKSWSSFQSTKCKQEMAYTLKQRQNHKLPKLTFEIGDFLKQALRMDTRD